MESPRLPATSNEVAVMLYTTILDTNWMSPKGSTKSKPTIVEKSDNNKALLGTDMVVAVKLVNLESFGWLEGKRRE